MKTSVITRQPVLTLYGGQKWDSSGDDIKHIYEKDLIQAQPGDRWGAYNTSNIGRGEYNAELECVYRNREGVALLLTEYGTTNSDDPEPYDRVPELIWYSFRGEE